jgi:hypothetical protein
MSITSSSIWGEVFLGVLDLEVVPLVTLGDLGIPGDLDDSPVGGSRVKDANFSINTAKLETYSHGTGL